MQGKFCQVYTTIASSFGSLIMGLLNVWPSYTSSLYTSNSTTPLSAPMTQAEVSLLGSLPSLGAMFGSAVVGMLINLLGRRNGGIVLTLPYILSWAIIGVSSSSKMVLAARFLSGIPAGAFLVYGPVFISEIAENSIRGALASGPMLFYCAGTLISYIVGWFMTYRVIIWMNLVMSVASAFLIMFVTESPVYLLRQKRDEDARAAIARYRGAAPSSIVVLEEFSRLKQQIMPAVELVAFKSDPETKEEEAEKEMLNSESTAPEKRKNMSAFKHLFLSPSCRRGFLVVLTVISMQVFMGMVPVQVYAKTVFTQTDPARSDMYTVIFALVMLCGIMLTTVIADKAGRKILLIASSALVCVCMATLGFLLQSRVAPPWVTVLVIMAFCFSFMFGAGSVPYVLLAEVFVPEVQNLASMLIVEWVWFLNFFIIGVFPYIISFLGMHGAFYAFACVGAANAVISSFIVPETKGLSNEQIQEIFLRRRKH